MMIKVFAWFNIVVGILVASLALLVELGFVWVATSLRGEFAWDRELTGLSMACVPLVLAGVLYAFSGLFLSRSDRNTLGKAVLFQGLALALAVFVSIGMLVFNPQANLMYRLELYFPAGFLLFMAIELGCLWLRWSKGKGTTNG